MKTFALTILLTVVAFNSYSQLREPDFINRVKFINNNDSINNTIELQQESATIFKTETAGAWIYITDALNSTIYYNVLEGLTSPNIIKQQSNLKFIIRVADNNVDPYKSVGIIKMNINQKNKSRFIELFSENSEKVFTKGKIEYVNCKFEKFGTNSYLIQIDNLSNGEYAITTGSDISTYSTFSCE